MADFYPSVGEQKAPSAKVSRSEIEGTGQEFCAMSLNVGMSYAFLMTRLESCVIGRGITEVRCHGQHTIWRVNTTNMTSPLMLTLITSLEVMFESYSFSASIL